MDFTIAKTKVIVAFFAGFGAGFWLKTLRDVPQCWLLWQKVACCMEKQSSTLNFFDSMIFLIMPKFNSISIIELASLVK